MKNLLCVALLAGSALSSSALGITVSAQPIEGGGGYIDRVATVYSSLTGGYASFPAATGPLGFDDYSTTNASDNVMTLAQFKFVGGVSTVGGTLTMQFFDPNNGNSLFNAFNVSLPQAGNFIWTITLGALPDGSDSTFVVPTNGIVQIVAAPTTTGQFFFTGAGLPAAVGSNNPAFGSGAALNRNQAFELVAVPAPGALAIVGLGGLVAARRRRA